MKVLPVSSDAATEQLLAANASTAWLSGDAPKA